MAMIGSDLGGVVIFLIILLIGIASVSVHYRKKYEELKKEVMREKGWYVR